MTSSPGDGGIEMLEGQLRELYGRTAYTHKSHGKMAALLTTRNRKLHWTQTVLSGLTTSLLVVLLGDKTVGAMITGGLSTALFIINLYQQNDDLGRRAERHTETAAVLWGIRETYLTLLTDLLSPQPDLSRIKSERDRMQTISERLYRSAPRTNNKAYERAQAGLKNNEELTFGEAELDLLLPLNLRKGPRKSKPTA